jgi:pimeloyl-ACP methyl ester carboxylesterase
MRCLILSAALVLLFALPSHGAVKVSTEELSFTSSDFQLVGDLRIPRGSPPFPVVLFVHGDGPNDRTAGITYPPIMQCMHEAGFATFAWDKPGTGESTGEFGSGILQIQRAGIVLDAIELLKAHPDIDSGRIGLWGISQAGYIMPRVIAESDDVAFMIAVSCPGEPGVEQGAYLVTAQAVCLGLSEELRSEVESLLSLAGRAQTWEEYADFKSRLSVYPSMMVLSDYGINVGVRPEDEWEADDPDGEYYWDPMPSVASADIPILAFFGERDTQADPHQGYQAYSEALEGSSLSRVVLIPGGDHNLLVCETGSLLERSQRSRRGWTDYVPLYLETLAGWLEDLP